MTRISVDILWISPKSCVESALQVCFWCWKCSGQTFFFPSCHQRKAPCRYVAWRLPGLFCTLFTRGHDETFLHFPSNEAIDSPTFYQCVAKQKKRSALNPNSNTCLTMEVFFYFLFICFHLSTKRGRYHITYCITKMVLSQGWIWIKSCSISIPFIGTT